MVADSTSLVRAASTASREVIADLQQAPLRFRQGPRLLAGGPADVAALLDAGRDADIPALVGRVGREPQQAYLLGGRTCDLAGGPAMRHRGGPGNAAGAITAAPQIDRLSAGRPAETPALLRWRRTHHPQSHMQILRLSRHQPPPAGSPAMAGRPASAAPGSTGSCGGHNNAWRAQGHPHAGFPALGRLPCADQQAVQPCRHNPFPSRHDKRRQICITKQSSPQIHKPSRDPPQGTPPSRRPPCPPGDPAWCRTTQRTRARTQDHPPWQDALRWPGRAATLCMYRADRTLHVRAGRHTRLAGLPATAAPHITHDQTLRGAPVYDHR